MRLADKYGIWRSWLMYYAKPFNRSRLKKFYSQFIKKDDVVFDIGAHLGNRSRAFLDLRARVIAVEPQPACNRFLKSKFGKYPSFELIEGLIGKESGKLPFFINSTSPTISTARDPEWMEEINQYSLIKPKWDKQIEVPVFTLDHLIESYGLPVFCKIDTEGFELEVLSGLNHCIPVISIEYLSFDKDRILACFNKIENLGLYEVNFSAGETQKWYWAEWKSINEIRSIVDQNKFNPVFGDFYFRKNPEVRQ